MPMIKPSQDGAQSDWDRLALDLTLAFSELDEDEFFILSNKKNGLYVQLAAQGKFGFRAEAVSAAYVGEDRIAKGVADALLALGWNAPTNLPEAQDPEGHTADGSPNFFLDIDFPVPFGSLARLAVVTMNQVFQTMHPGELKYQAFGADNVSVRFPHLQITRER
jgi:hypothetical protein